MVKKKKWFPPKIIHFFQPQKMLGIHSWNLPCSLSKAFKISPETPQTSPDPRDPSWDSAIPGDPAKLPGPILGRTWERMVLGMVGMVGMVGIPPYTSWSNLGWLGWWWYVVKTMSFLPPMTGNGWDTVYTSYCYKDKNGDDWGMVYEIRLPTLCLLVFSIRQSAFLVFRWSAASDRQDMLCLHR